MLWLVVIVLLALQIVCRAFGAKRYRLCRRGNKNAADVNLEHCTD